MSRFPDAYLSPWRDEFPSALVSSLLWLAWWAGYPQPLMSRVRERSRQAAQAGDGRRPAWHE